MNPVKSYVNYIRQLLAYCDISASPNKFALFTLWFPFLTALIISVFFLREQGHILFAVGAAAFVAAEAGIFGFLILAKNRRAEAAEEAMPDFLLLASNNIRSGMTPDRALIASAKDEFGVLSREVMRVMRETVSGRPFEEMLMKVTERIDSRTIENTVRLVVEGMYSGGELPSLLERTSYDIRTMKTLRKDVQALIVTYQMFIASAVMFGAPILFAVATHIVEIMIALRAKITISGLAVAGGLIPLGSAAGVSADTLMLFAVSAIFVNSLFASVAIGLISKGRKVEGLGYFPLVFLVSLAFFFLVRLVLKSALGGVLPV
ncbi:MAG: type II secretion system F family protein [Candidatus Micrarchaeota archaeon]